VKDKRGITRTHMGPTLH